MTIDATWISAFAIVLLLLMVGLWWHLYQNWRKEASIQGRLFGNSSIHQVPFAKNTETRPFLDTSKPFKVQSMSLLRPFLENPSMAFAPISSLPNYHPTEMSVSFHAEPTVFNQPTFASLLTLFQSKMADKTHLQDDLTAIQGITPELAVQLNRIGIYTYEDIASWSSLDIRRISVALELHTQILDQHWIVQAQNLCYQLST